MALDPIPQSLPVHFFGSRPQPPTSPIVYECVSMYECVGVHECGGVCTSVCVCVCVCVCFVFCNKICAPSAPSTGVSKYDWVNLFGCVGVCGYVRVCGCVCVCAYALFSAARSELCLHRPPALESVCKRFV